MSNKDGCGIAFTVADMKAAGVGRFVPARNGDVAWGAKKRIYEGERVWGYYNGARERYKVTFTTADGFIDQAKANEVAQAEIDNLILKRAGGIAVVLPGQKEEVEKKEDAATKDVFAGKQEASYAESMWWIYRNLKIDGVKPEDCPDSGTWGYYQMLLGNPDAQAKFYETVFPKVAGKEVDEKTMVEDDKRVHFKVLDILDKEFADAGL